MVLDEVWEILAFITNGLRRPATCSTFLSAPQQIRIVIEGMPGYVPTALVALTLDDAERLCDRLNVRLGLDRKAWCALAGRSMRGDGIAPDRGLNWVLTNCAPRGAVFASGCKCRPRSGDPPHLVSSLRPVWATMPVKRRQRGDRP